MLRLLFYGGRAVRKDRERVTRALDSLSSGLAPYVERQFAIDVYHEPMGVATSRQQSFRDDRGVRKAGSGRAAGTPMPC